MGGLSVASVFLALAILVVIGVVGARNIAAMQTAFEWVEHTHDVRGQLFALDESLVTAEASRRGFAIAGDDALRTMFDDANVHAMAALSRARALTADNPEQQRRLAALEPLVEERFAMLRAARPAGAEADANAAADTERHALARAIQAGAAKTREVRAAIAVADAEEQRLLIVRECELQTDNRRMVVAIIAGALLVPALLGAVFARLRREVAARGREIAERKHVEIERDRFYELSIDMIAIAGMDGVFRRVNPAFTRTLGYTADELRARPFLDYVHPDDRAATLRETERLSEGAVTVGFENRYLCKDGSYKWLQWSTVPDLAEKTLFAIARDTTEQRAQAEKIVALNEELAERVRNVTAVNAELESFSYSVSHDLRAPLRGIDGFSQALLEDYAGALDDTAKDYLTRVRAGTQRMGHLIDDLLQLSQITRAPLRREATDMSAIARAIVAELRHEDASRDMTTVIADDLHVSADPKLLRVALENLLSNAWKFTSKIAKARIEVGASSVSRGQHVYFVSDNGAGFDMAHAGKLFGAFQRLHGVAEFPGTGIGLATVRRVMARHDGRVWAEAKVGEGATFYFSL